MATCLHINLIFTGVYSVDLTPVKQKENRLVGTSVSLSYTLSKIATGSDYFFWYRQYPVEPPQFLLYISGLGINRTAESLGSDKRFSTELTEEKTGVDLKISSDLTLVDTALYYCNNPTTPFYQMGGGSSWFIRDILVLAILIMYM
uniref:Immunoglobulin V-set domain-containing protein n=1 Tax=Gadus morhua TaxID=8049 RepID=A0A8C4ZWU4_GADMO